MIPLVRHRNTGGAVPRCLDAPLKRLGNIELRVLKRLYQKNSHAGLKSICVGISLVNESQKKPLPTLKQILRIQQHNYMAESS